MDRFIIGVKKTQSQQFNEKGLRISTTQIVTSPVTLVGIKTKESDGYYALVLGLGTAKKIAKSVEGTLKKAGITTKPAHLVEFPFDPTDLVVAENDGKKTVKIGDTTFALGDTIKPATMFALNDKVMVTATSKGKGFQGVVRRHHFKGGSKTHGQSDRQRAPGAIGMTTTPGRVFRGKRMAGRMGNDTVTVKGLRVVSLTDSELVVSGTVPGAVGGIVRIRKNS